MPERTKINTDNLTRYAPFFGGMYEVGGGMRIVTEHQKRTNKGRVYEYDYAIPYLTFGDGAREKVEWLKIALETGVIIEHGNSFDWRLKSTNAILGVQSFRPFTPSRQPHAEIFQRWAKLDPYSRLQLVDDFSKIATESKHNVTPESYEELIRDPLFLAGVFWARAFHFTQRSTTEAQPLKINSLNRPLLQAIKATYGGFVDTEHRYKEKERLVIDKAWLPGQVPSLIEIGSRDSARILSIIEPVLPTPLAA